MRSKLLRFLSLMSLFLLIISPLAKLSHAQHNPPGCIPPPPGLVGWWPGDGDAVDLLNGNDGILHGGATFTPGKVGGAFHLDGSDDYVEIADAGATPNLDGFPQLTIDAWINPTTWGNPNPDNGRPNSAIVGKYNSTHATGVSYFLDLDNGHLRFAFARSVSPVSLLGLRSQMTLNTNQWTHVAGVWRGGSQLELYVNGVPVPGNLYNEGSPPATMADNNIPVNIGRFTSFSGSYTGPSGYFHGAIDEVEIFNRALTPGEIQAIFNAGSAGKCKIDELTVSIDIHPGSDPNSVNVKSNGVIPVAIISTASFEAGSVDPLTVQFGPSGAAESHRHGHQTDIDGDGDLDLLLHFRSRESGIQCGDQVASLTGYTYGGQAIWGFDVVKVVGCK